MKQNEVLTENQNRSRFTDTGFKEANIQWYFFLNHQQASEFHYPE